MILTIVIGPMFSGKSTFIINKASETNDKYIVLKPIIDNRYSENMVVSHDKQQIKATSSNKLLNSLLLDNILKCKKIYVDEGQFFDDLYDFVEYLDEKKYTGELFVCGLNGDFKRKPIGKINSLLPRADDIIFLKGICSVCGKKSSFSKKIINVSDNYDQIDFGGSEKYHPVCGKCYLN